MDFGDIVAGHEADLVRAACRSEGFDVGLTEEVMARHLADPSCMDLVERYGDGVRFYVRSLAREISGASGPWGSPPRAGE
jgi:hypothetical protein